MRSFAVAVVVAIAATLSQSVSGAEPVKVSAYYETHCPDSKHFITSQLTPTFRALGDIMTVDLIPYGKASYQVLSNGSIVFQCQHGQRECKGNRIQSCALSLLSDPHLTTQFIYCMERDWSPELAAQRCAEENNINYEPIESCANSQRGDELLMENGKRTESLNPRLNFVPWININDVHSDETQDESLSNLKGVVCSAYTGTKPNACL